MSDGRLWRIVNATGAGFVVGEPARVGGTEGRLIAVDMECSREVERERRRLKRVAS
jgi:hypothetical protein